jgi:hypothetical protein
MGMALISFYGTLERPVAVLAQQLGKSAERLVHVSGRRS